MVEIKFRAWDSQTKTIAPVVEILFDQYGGADVRTSALMGINSRSLGPASLMQFTGLKDKNGTEIYEGDVVRQGKEVAAVKYDDVFPEFVAMAPLKNECSNNLLFGDCEVIGNIYENPELLKKPTDN